MKAILFDLDDTLYPYHPSHEAGLDRAVDFLCGPLDLDGAELRRRYYEVRQRATDRLGPVAASHSRHLYFKWMVEEARGACRPALSLEATEAYWSGALEQMAPSPGCLELLETLRGAGLELAILTDLTVDIQLRKLEALGLADYFPRVMTSEESGRDKPDPAGFRRLLEQLAMGPGEVVMVGDNAVNDVQGAHALGIQPLWISHGRERPLPEGCWQVPDLAELNRGEWLERLGVPPS